MSLTPIQQKAEILSSMARVAIEMGYIHSLDEAIDKAIEAALSVGERARHRQGEFRYETTSEELEDAVFFSSVAEDAADNTYRPSTGPVRDYVMSMLVLI